uniref:Conserved oligomeric Golgi complex subunit 8 n=1 Tax=Angiostrongylus cantonensis TaxID=6313 RepID=A0A0K0CZ88_ANGCA
MNLPSQFKIEHELKTMGSEQLRRERSLILNDLRSLDDQIGDLAFNNYRTYADAGRTTQHCTEIFTEMSEKLRVVSEQIPKLASELQSFHTCAKNVSNELDIVQSACQKESALWELLSLPSAIADKLVEARSFLLEELFNKFSGPLDLASSIQVVNNVRKMPNLTSTQLRICILQHRDIYLNRQISDITNHPEFAIRAIEIYRDCMYDTLVLYLAVFPENEPPRKDVSHLFLLNGVDMCTIWSKLMSLAASLGRMGLDFRALVVDCLTKMVLERFRSSIRATTNVFLNDTKVLSVVNEEISSLSVDRDIPANGPPVPPPEISLWDDICIYGNGILDAINDLRYSPYPLLVRFRFSSKLWKYREISFMSI